MTKSIKSTHFLQNNLFVKSLFNELEGRKFENSLKVVDRKGDDYADASGLYSSNKILVSLKKNRNEHRSVKAIQLEIFDVFI